MKLLFERSRAGRGSDLLPACDVPVVTYDQGLLRAEAPRLPEMAEVDLSRHYTELAKQTHGVNDGFYPLGSCTMKYNPRVNEEAAAQPGFTQLHPLQPVETVQGALEVIYTAEKMLCEITGMDGMTFQPAAGAHGEYTGLLLIRKYHQSRGDTARTKIIVPDSAHGTNPASATMAGFKVVSVPSNEQGGVDLDALRKAVGPDTAGLMLTNPNTVGLFDPNILEITQIIHDAGGLCYYDGANLNAIMGHVRPGDMGFDCVHLNLHKTFSTPHGGGGPGSGPVGVRKGLEDYLPNPQVYFDEVEQQYAMRFSKEALGSISSWLGNFGILVRAYAYLLTLGHEHIAQAAKLSVLNANYIKEQLKDYYELPIEGLCKHEFVFDGLRAEYGGDHHDPDHATTLQVAKRLLDFGFHAPTIYFPLLFHEAMMIEPTENESKETLDRFIEVLKNIAIEARDNRESLRTAPHCTPISRPDDVKAVREPRFKF